MIARRLGASFTASLLIGAAPVSLTLIDAARHRPVPVLLYGEAGARRPLAILSHGYGDHAGEYGFLAHALVRRGYLVAAVEHLEQPGDPPMVDGIDLAVRRRPVWQVGVETIGFVAAELARRHLAAPGRLLLVGHFNGDDMTMLFATEHPRRVRIALSLDNRRQPLPRTHDPRICTLRSSDQPADPGVLPPPAEAARLGILIRPVPVAHADMTDAAPATAQTAMLAAVAACLDGGT